MSYSTLTDTELWNLFLSGDKKALAYIYSQQYKLLLGYGVKLIPDIELVRDCIQDLFVKLFTNRKNISSTQHINGYLIRALKNRLYDEMSTTVEMLTLESLPFDFKADDFFLSRFAENDHDLLERKKLQKAIDKLSSHQREVVYLRFVRELSYEEIGEVLGINYQSAKNLLSRTLVKIREDFCLNNEY